MRHAVNSTLIGILTLLSGCSGKTIDGGSSEAPAPTSTGTAGGETPPSSAPKPRVCNVKGAIHRLMAVRTLDTPQSALTGLAWDGEGLYALTSGVSGDRKLIRFDPTSGEIQRGFVLDTIQAKLSVSASGIAWDGQSIWIGSTSGVVAIDPTTGALRKSYVTPTALSLVDLESDGDKLWLSSGTGEVFTVERESGKVAFAFKTAGTGTHDSGMAIRDGEVWIGHLDDNLQVYDRAGSVLGDVLHSTCSRITREEIGASAFVGSQLAINSRGHVTFYDVLDP